MSRISREYDSYSYPESMEFEEGEFIIQCHLNYFGIEYSVTLKSF